MNTLHDDVLIEIFKYSDNVYNLQLVCQHYNELFNNESIIWTYYLEKYANDRNLIDIINDNDYGKYKQCHLLNLTRKTFNMECFTLHKLYCMEIFGTSITNNPFLHKEVVNLKSLKVLYWHVTVEIVPKEIGQLTNLTTLNLAHNKIKSLPT